MDAAASGPSSIQYQNIPEQAIASFAPPPVAYQRQQRHCFGNEGPGEFPLSANPSIVLHFLTACNLDPQDLAKLEATCSFFRQPANFAPDNELSLPELAALDMCRKRAVFKPMAVGQQQELKQMCGGSWKLVLRYLLAGEVCYRREKAHAIAGPGHSLVVTNGGGVYSFGSNSSGQLGHGSMDEESRPRLIRSLQGIRIIHAAAGPGRTMLISDAGRVYAFGKDSFGENEYGGPRNKSVTTPQLVDSLKDIFVVQAAIGNFFTAVLSREGRVYTFSWGDENKLGHQTEINDREPRPLLGPLENIPVVQIAAGYCYLLALACQPGGIGDTLQRLYFVKKIQTSRSVYSVGCGLGGKLGHGTKNDEKLPRLIEQFRTLNLQPVVISAGAWHAAVAGKDGRVCTWGWGRYGCLGHGNEDCESVPKVVEALGSVKAIHVATGDYTTFVVSDGGEVYSFGCGDSSSLGHRDADEQGLWHVLTPRTVTSLKQINERIVQISLTNTVQWNAHTFALTDTDKLYAFGSGDKGQLGLELGANERERTDPERVDIDLG
ncbi:hypothetical protein OROMI_010265 [Orobanche minor]